MSATTAGAMKAHLERAGLGLAWFRDRAPQDQALPFGVIQEGISRTSDRDGDHTDPAARHGVREQVQVAVYDLWRDGTGKAAERYDLPDALHRALHGAVLTDLPSGRPGFVRVDGYVRIPQVDGPGSAGDPANRANIVQHALTCTVARST